MTQSTSETVPKNTLLYQCPVTYNLKTNRNAKSKRARATLAVFARLGVALMTSKGHVAAALPVDDIVLVQHDKCKRKVSLLGQHPMGDSYFPLWHLSFSTTTSSSSCDAAAVLAICSTVMTPTDRDPIVFEEVMTEGQDPSFLGCEDMSSVFALEDIKEMVSVFSDSHHHQHGVATVDTLPSIGTKTITISTEEVARDIIPQRRLEFCAEFFMDSSSSSSVIVTFDADADFESYIQRHVDVMMGLVTESRLSEDGFLLTLSCDATQFVASIPFRPIGLQLLQLWSARHPHDLCRVERNTDVSFVAAGDLWVDLPTYTAKHDTHDSNDVSLPLDSSSVPLMLDSHIKALRRGVLEEETEAKWRHQQHQEASTSFVVFLEEEEKEGSGVSVNDVDLDPHAVAPSSLSREDRRGHTADDVVVSEMDRFVAPVESLAPGSPTPHSPPPPPLSRDDGDDGDGLDLNLPNVASPDTSAPPPIDVPLGQALHSYLFKSSQLATATFSSTVVLPKPLPSSACVAAPDVLNVDPALLRRVTNVKDTLSVLLRKCVLNTATAAASDPTKIVILTASHEAATVRYAVQSAMKKTLNRDNTTVDVVTLPVNALSITADALNKWLVEYALSSEETNTVVAAAIFSHVNPITGTVLPARRLAEALRAFDVPLILEGTFAVGNLTPDELNLSVIAPFAYVADLSVFLAPPTTTSPKVSPIVCYVHDNSHSSRNSTATTTSVVAAKVSAHLRIMSIEVMLLVARLWHVHPLFDAHHSHAHGVLVVPLPERVVRRFCACHVAAGDDHAMERRLEEWYGIGAEVLHVEGRCCVRLCLRPWTCEEDLKRLEMI
eukprot:PhM_4_TR18643/c0_g1_i1/m.99405